MVHSAACFLPALLLTLLPFGAAASARPAAVVSPGHQVRTFSFTIEVEVPVGASFDPAGGATLNGVPVPVAGGPSRDTAEVSPGFPLLDDNRLDVVVEAGGKTRTTLERHAAALSELVHRRTELKREAERD
jgi:hypothetical protein